MMCQRSNTATRIRAQAGCQIFDCNPMDLRTPEKHYEKFKSRIGWREVEIEGKKVEQYETWNVEVLHSSYNGAHDIRTVFLNPVLMRVSHIISSRFVLLPVLDIHLDLLCLNTWPCCCHHVAFRTTYRLFH